MLLTWFAIVQSLSQFLSFWGIAFVPDIIFDKLINFNILKFVFLCQFFGMVSFSTAWRSHKQHVRWPSRSLRPCQLQDSHDLFKDNAFRTISIELNNLSLACLLHTFDLTIQIVKQFILNNTVCIRSGHSRRTARCLPPGIKWSHRHSSSSSSPYQSRCSRRCRAWWICRERHSSFEVRSPTIECEGSLQWSSWSLRDLPSPTAQSASSPIQSQSHPWHNCSFSLIQR